MPKQQISAHISPEGFTELVYAENITVESQTEVLKLGLEIANEASLLDKGIEILIDATKSKTYDNKAMMLTKHAAESVPINHIAVFGTQESLLLIQNSSQSFGDINNVTKYFTSREEAVVWLESVRSDSCSSSCDCGCKDR